MAKDRVRNSGAGRRWRARLFAAGTVPLVALALAAASPVPALAQTADTTTTTEAATTTTTAPAATTTTAASGDTTTTSAAQETTTTTECPTTTTTSASSTTTTAGGSTTTTGASSETTTTTAAAGCGTTPTTSGSTTTTAGGTTQTKATVVGDPNVKPGQQVTFQGGGFAKNAPLALEFQSTPTPLGNATADASGNFKATVTIPNDATGGAHHLVARGPGANGGTNEAVADVTVVAAGQIAVTGKELVGWALVGLSFLAMTLILFAARRRVDVAMSRR